ncbi:MAG TPA: hypothetical protein VGX25_06845 [Actinophytocola sp.]|uniref:hypothetical protein n=1 Tax=Actinophytocola sp. TaxID=1872138 RepID=UPI002DDCDC35|nr:hypothetical protein [Actinophytocola sp.]HEV2779106.1 hypothetical protein [Actinophytocola sp.]
MAGRHRRLITDAVEGRRKARRVIVQARLRVALADIPRHDAEFERAHGTAGGAGRAGGRRVGLLALLVVLLPVSVACEGESAPTPGDKVIVKRVPQRSSKDCWEMRIARGGDKRKVDILCVTERKWRRYREGDPYP